MSTFCQRLYHRKCQLRGVGGQKEPKSCQRSLWTTPKGKLSKHRRQNISYLAILEGACLTYALVSVYYWKLEFAILLALT